MAELRPVSIGPEGKQKIFEMSDTILNIPLSTDQRFIQDLDQHSLRIFKSSLSNSSTSFTPVKATAYFVFLGRVVVSFIPKYVEFHVAGAASGAQIAEVGFFSSTNPPNKSSHTLSKIVSSDVVTSLTSQGIKRNTTSFSISLVIGTYLWAGLRVNMASKQPDVSSLVGDMSQGLILKTDAALTLTGTGPWVATILPLTTNANCVDLRGTMD